MQEIIVWIVVIACTLLLIRSIVQYFKRIKEKSNPCEGCSGCELYKKKPDECTKKR